MYAVVKKFEGDFAVCEVNSEQIISIERIYLPREARKGSPFLVDRKMIGAIEAIMNRCKCESVEEK